MQQPKRFSDFAKDDRPLDGDKMKIEDILDQEILVLGFKMRDSKFSKRNSDICLTLQFEVDGKRHVLFTGSTVLADQMTKYHAELPFLARIVRIDRYYTFS